MPGERVLDFFVPGVPIPEGSLKALMTRDRKRAFVVHDDGPALKKWRKAIGDAARYYMGVRLPFAEDAIEVNVTFTVTRPRTVTREYPTVPPDADKLMRAVGDALKGVVYKDDGQSVDLVVRKRYEGHAEASREGIGAHIVIWVLGRLT